MNRLALATLLIAAVAPALAQNTQTRCYRSGNTTICQSRDQYGRTLQETRCYPSGNITICDTRNEAGPPAPLYRN